MGKGKRAQVIPRVSVKSRHRASCKYKSDVNFLSCDCPKQLLWSKNGVLNRISAETEDYRVAERKARDRKAKFERQANGQPEPETPMLVEPALLQSTAVPDPAAPKSEVQWTIADAVQRFLQSKRDAGYTDKSVGKLKLWLEDRFLDYCNRQNLVYISEVKLIHLEHWRSGWNGQASTRNKIQGRIQGFFTWCFNREMIAKNPALGLEKIKTNGRKPTIALSDEQFAQVLDAVNLLNGRSTEDTRRRLRGLILLMRWSGLAIGDALTLERTKLKADIDGWYRLFLRRAKTGVEVYCAIAPEVAAEILAVPNDNPRYFFCNGSGTKEELVHSWTRVFSRLSERANLKNEDGEPLDFHSHILRDTFAVWCFNRDMSTEDVAALLGHSNIQTTQQHYSPWIASRQQRLVARLKTAWSGAQAQNAEAQGQAAAAR